MASPGSRSAGRKRLAILPVAAALLVSGAASGQETTTLFTDSAARADPTPVWGRIDCALDRGPRQRQELLGGDLSRTDNSLVGATAFRRLTVFDGDDAYGERCELGLNDWREGPTALFHEGERRVTYLALRLPRSFPLEAGRWQTVMQMKQTQPSDGGGGSPMVSLEAYGGDWRLNVARAREGRDWTRWRAPARRGSWTRFILDVRYSRNPRLGWVRLFADLNGDGDTADRAERSGLIRGPTLKTETPNEGAPDGVRRGNSIPSHLRVGIYHHESISCPRGCSIDVDSVRVVSKPVTDPG
jgi:hypothetical protein